jgi:hypothetical protein
MNYQKIVVLALIFLTACIKSKLIDYEDAKLLFQQDQQSLSIITSYLIRNPQLTSIDQDFVWIKGSKNTSPGKPSLPKWLKLVVVGEKVGTFRFYFKGDFPSGTSHGFYYTPYPTPDFEMKKYNETVFRPISKNWYYFIFDSDPSTR